MSTLTTIDVSASKTIGELNPTEGLGVGNKRAMLLPTEFNGENYKILISELLALLTKSDIGLGRVDNTNDSEKPISLLTSQALQGKANTGHIHAISNIEGLAQALTTFFDKDSQIPLVNLNAVVQALAGKAAVNHEHALATITGLVEALAQKAGVNHNHTLSTLIGYNELMAAMSQSFNQRPLTTAVVQMIAEAIPVLPTNLVTETAPEW